MSADTLLDAAASSARATSRPFPFPLHRSHSIWTARVAVVATLQHEHRRSLVRSPRALILCALVLVDRHADVRLSSIIGHPARSGSGPRGGRGTPRVRE